MKRAIPKVSKILTNGSKVSKILTNGSKKPCVVKGCYPECPVEKKDCIQCSARLIYGTPQRLK